MNNKEDEPAKRAGELFRKTSALQQFQNKYRESFETLTDREVEILTLIAEGLKDTAIAERLDISGPAVQKHRANIRQKLSVESHADHVKYALAFGLVRF